MSNDLKTVIDDAFEKRAEITPLRVDTMVKEARQTGQGRTACRGKTKWQVGR